ncbi:MAG: ABC transporter permease [bacterium]|nr:ABC transporter permease [bacterium]
MGRYILRRILISIPVLLIITMMIFSLLELAPGDMLDYFLTDDALQFMTEEDIEDLRDKLGLNDPMAVRYVKWLGRTLQGNLGYSFVQNEPVSEILIRRLKNSLILMGTSLFFGIIIGIPLGIFISLKQYSFWDFGLTGVSFIGLSMPAFVTGIIGMYLFSIRWTIFPAGGMYSAGGSRSFGDLLMHLMLPAFILASAHIARNMRYTRFSMLDVIKQDYIVTATSKGLKRHIIINRHALRNALIPVITIIGMSVPQLIVGAVFLETIFNWPGMGVLYYNAVLARDFPIVMGANLIIALIVLLANLLTDITYALIDPRVRYN